MPTLSRRKLLSLGALGLCVRPLLADLSVLKSIRSCTPPSASRKATRSTACSRGERVAVFSSLNTLTEVY